jgi:O-phosphoseryl-tRNA(Cys) synthetase
MVLIVYCVFFYFATLDSSDVGVGEEGFEEFEEVQGQISQPRQAIS